MTVRSVSFDDEDDGELHVFSGNDLLIAHYDLMDLDWSEIAERTMLDERRGLVIAQVAVLEDMVDEFIHYLDDPPTPDALQAKLERQTLGPRLDLLESLLRRGNLADSGVERLLAELRTVVERRNELAHGTLYWRPIGGPPPLPLTDQDVMVEWIVRGRRGRTTRRITMSGLRRDLYDAIGAVTALVDYSERFVEQAPTPLHFRGGAYLSPPTP